MVNANYDEALLPMNMYLGLKQLWFNQTTHIHVIEVKTIQHGAKTDLGGASSIQIYG